MKKHRKRLILIAIFCVIVWRAWPTLFVFSGLNLSVSSDFSQLAKVLPPEQIPTSAHFGMSHQTFEMEALLKEILLQRRKIIHGHPFFPEERNGPLIEDIASILAESGSLHRWVSEKMCGGFHADYYIAWQVGSDTWEALLCMGCHEVILFHDGLSLRCDLDDDAARRIEAIEKNRTASEVATALTTES